MLPGGFPPYAGASRPRKRWVVPLVIGGALVLVLALFAVAVPTFLATERNDAGRTWFQNGVPASWSPGNVKGLNANETLEAAWRTPGPTVEGFYPCVFVVQEQVQGWSALSTSNWFADLSSAATSDGWRAQQVTLADGAPALSVYAPWATGHDATYSDVSIGEYVLYAKKGADFYRGYVHDGRPGLRDGGPGRGAGAQRVHGELGSAQQPGLAVKRCCACNDDAHGWHIDGAVYQIW
jgi:hypothetical protein